MYTLISDVIIANSIKDNFKKTQLLVARLGLVAFNGIYHIVIA